MSSFFRQGIGYWTVAGLFVLIWSCGFPVSKVAVGTCPPELFLAFRFGAAGAIMIGWAWWRGYLNAALPWLSLICLGLLNFAVTNGLAWSGVTTVSAGLATIIMSANPVLTAVVATLLLGDHMKPMRALGLVLGISGVAFIIRNRIVLGGEDMGGVLQLVGALCAQSAGIILFKLWSPRLPLTVLVGVQQTSAAVALLVVGLAIEPTSAIHLNTAFWATLGYSAIINSVVSFQLWFFILAHGSATSATSLQFLMPPLGLLSSWALLGEEMPLMDLVGIVPVALGIRLASRR